MIKYIKDAVRGAGYLPGYGEHPGTLFLVMFIVMGALAGAWAGGVTGAAGGALIMALFMGSIFVIGSVDRYRSWLKSEHNSNRS